MAETQDPNNEHTEATFSGGQEVADALNHNSEILASKVKSVVDNVLAFLGIVDNKKCFSYPIILHVDRTSGRIVDITSVEAERRKKAFEDGFFQESDMPTGIVNPAVSTEVEDVANSDIVMVPASRLTAFPNLDSNAPHPEGKILVDRPESWNRNDQVTLKEDVLRSIENLIPDPIERGVFLKSLDSYNNAPEPAEVSASK